MQKKVKEVMGDSFWTARGIRQSCSLSPILFNLSLANIKEELEKVKRGREIKLIEGRIYSLVYVDDI